MTTREEVKMYSDYKSPYAWLGFDPAFALEEKFAVKVSIDLGGSDTFMAEHFLNGTEIRASFHHMGCKRMPESVG